MKRGNFQELVGKTIHSVDATALNHVQLVMDDGSTYHLDAELHNQIPAISILHVPNINPRIAAFTDDLSIGQMQELMTWFLHGHHSFTPANIKHWRKEKGLPVDPAD